MKRERGIFETMAKIIEGRTLTDGRIKMNRKNGILLKSNERSLKNGLKYNVIET